MLHRGSGQIVPSSEVATSQEYVLSLPSDQESHDPHRQLMKSSGSNLLLSGGTRSTKDALADPHLGSGD